MERLDQNVNTNDDDITSIHGSKKVPYNLELHACLVNIDCIFVKRAQWLW